MELKQLALHQQHLALGAKMVPFAGFEMPIQYSSIVEEHLAVRQNVGCFDVSHMGEFWIGGSEAERWLNRMTVNNVAALEVGQAQYSAMLYPDGGIVDDLIVYRFSDHFMMVVNAANIAKDFNWLNEHITEGVELRDISDQVTLLAIQGRNAPKVVGKIFGREATEIKYYHFTEYPLSTIIKSPSPSSPPFFGRVVVSRTGYTGDDGFEIYIDREHSLALWERVWEVGREEGMKPAGLGARDSLRLEAGYALYGNDIDATTNPIEAGLGWITKLNKPENFIGKEAVLSAKSSLKRRLMAFVVEDKLIPRPHFSLLINNETVGYVTSGGFSPILNKPIGMGYVAKPHDQEGNEVIVEGKGRSGKALIVPKPFYKRDY